MKFDCTRFDRRWLAGAAGIVIALVLSLSHHVVVAQDGEIAQDGEEETNQDEADEQLFAVPDGNAEQLVEYLTELIRTQPGDRTPEEARAFLVRKSGALIQASDKLLGAKPNDDQAANAYMVKLVALQQLGRLGDETADAKQEKLAIVIRQDPRDRVAAIGWNAFARDRLSNWQTLPEAEKREFLKELLVESKTSRRSAMRAELLSQVAGQLEIFDERLNESFTKDLLSQAIALFKGIDDPNIQENVSRWKGTYRRLNLLGNRMELEGSLLGGAELDWDSYRGKVVLVDFWATWCPPCIRELPNVQAMYKAYHDQGFEVIGISLDDSEQELQAFVEQMEVPWDTLFPAEQSDRGWGHPMARRYGISSVPTAILLDREGKAVDLDARDERLRSKLQELIGDPLIEEATESLLDGAE